jgi:hypothetical protein
VLEDDKDALPGGEEEKLVAGGLTGFIIVNQQPETHTRFNNHIGECQSWLGPNLRARLASI